MKELLTGKLGQVKLGQAINRVTLNQVTMGLAFALALVAIVSSVLIAPRSNEQVIELVPLQAAEQVQATANPSQTGAAIDEVGASVEVRQPASLEGQTSTVETSGATASESTLQESTLQELPVNDQANPTEQATSSSATEQATSLGTTVPGTIPTRATEKIAETPYLEKDIPAASVPIAQGSTTGKRTAPTRNTVTRSSLPLRRDAGSVSVQAGAFKSLENAQKLTSRLQAAGIRAGVEKGKTMYRVLVGPYASESDARAAARGVLPLAQ
jgi:cell division septation protein DedD